MPESNRRPAIANRTIATGTEPGRAAKRLPDEQRVTRRMNGSAPASSPTARVGVTVTAEVAVNGLDNPVDVTNAGDGSGRLFVVEQAGVIRVIRDGAALDRPFLDIRDRIASGGERGLLGLA